MAQSSAVSVHGAGGSLSVGNNSMYAHNLNYNSQKHLVKEKIQKMKEIKRYFDQFFKELKDHLKEMMNQTDEFMESGVFVPRKTEQVRQQECDELQKLVKKTYDRL